MASFDNPLARWFSLALALAVLPATQSAAQVICPISGGGRLCVPNVRYFGYYPRIWQPWPDEVRTDQVFPESIGAEPIPTPPGTVPPPLPRRSLAEPPPEVPPVEPEDPEVPPPPFEEIPPLPGIPEDDLLDPQDIPSGETEPNASHPLERPAGLAAGRERTRDLAASNEFRRGSMIPEPPLPLSPFAPVADWSPEMGAAEGQGEIGVSPLPPEGLSLSHPTAASSASASLPDWSDTPAAAEAGFAESSDAPRFESAERPALQAAYEAATDSPEPSSPSTGSAGLAGLDGFCPVTINEQAQWMEGDERWTVVHRGRAYRMADAARYERFRLTPDRYAPVLGGDDPTAAIDDGRRIPGLSDHCVVYEGRLYMFASESSLVRFRQNPRRYANEVLAGGD